MQRRRGSPRPSPSSIAIGGRAVAARAPGADRPSRAGGRAARRRRAAGAPRRGPRTTPGSARTRAPSAIPASRSSRRRSAGQVLRVGVAGPVERLAHRDPQARGGQPGRQPVDRHDRPGVEHLAVALDRLELGVVDRQRRAEPLEPARDDDLAAPLQAPLDEPPAEPGRLDLAGLVLEAGDRALDPAAAGRPRPGRRRPRPAPTRRSPPPPRRGRRSSTARAGRRSAAGRWNSRSRTSYQPSRMPARRSRLGGRQPGLGERRRQELDRVGRAAAGAWASGSPRSSPSRPATRPR